MLLCIIFKVSVAVRNKTKIGKFINLEKSNIFDTEGKIKRKNLIPLVVNWMANSGHQFVFHYCFYLLKLGGSNQSIIIIVTTLAIVFNGIAFYFGFGETLSVSKLCGMGCAIASVIFLALSKSGETAKTVQVSSETRLLTEVIQTDPKYTYIAIGLSIIVPVLFSTKHFFTRKFAGSYEVEHMGVDSAILESGTCVVVFIIYCVNYGI